MNTEDNDNGIDHRESAADGGTVVKAPSRLTKLLATSLLSAGVLAGTMAVGVQPASAHARCDLASHRHWHMFNFHNYRHYFAGYTQINRYQRLVYFTNDQHPDHKYTVLCG